MPLMETKTRFSASLAPHIFAKDTTAVLMLDVIAALMPTVAAGIWLFGWNAARVILSCVVSCVGFEVEGLDALYARLKEAGIETWSEGGIVEMKDGRRAVVVRDPDIGAFIELFETAVG